MKNQLEKLVINILKQLIQLISRVYKKGILSKLYGIIQPSEFKDKDYRDSKLEHLLQEGSASTFNTKKKPIKNKSRVDAIVKLAPKSNITDEEALEFKIKRLQKKHGL